MIRLALYLVLAACALAALHYLALWMERRGWIYYWRKSSSTGAGSAALGAAMQELNALAEPEARNVIEVQQADRQRRDLFDGLANDEPEQEL